MATSVGARFIAPSGNEAEAPGSFPRPFQPGSGKATSVRGRFIASPGSVRGLGFPSPYFPAGLLTGRRFFGFGTLWQALHFVARVTFFVRWQEMHSLCPISLALRLVLWQRPHPRQYFFPLLCFT